MQIQKKIKTNCHKLLVVISFLVFENNYGQTNLVPNPSFEQYTTCPISSRNDKPNIWYKPDYRGAGYYNACSDSSVSGVPIHGTTTGSSFQYARTGIAYILMFYRNSGDSRNYFQVKLLDSLQLGKCYYAECYVSLSNPFRLGCNNQSMLFTKKAIYVDTLNTQLLPANPQITNYNSPIITDTLNWVKISGIFKAQGGEQYLTLGNFRDNANTAYTIIQPTGYFGAAYYVDDVAVYALDSFCLKADAGRDTTIAQGDSVFIGSYTNGIDSLKWQIQNTNTTIDSTRPGFWVHPTVTTSYVLQQVVNGCFSTDTVVVTVGTVPLTMMNYELRIMNDKQIENRWVTANEVNVSHFNIQRSINAKDFITIGKVAANNKSYNEYSFTDNGQLSTVDGGLYYRIESIDKDGKKQYSETRTITLKPQTLNGVNIYPNPAKDILTVNCVGMKELNIINSLGQTVIHQTINNNMYKLNIQSLSKGLYLLNIITTKNNVYAEKLIVQ